MPTLTVAEKTATAALKQARARAGVGWNLLSSDLRQALVAYEALMILGNMAGEKYAPAVAVADAVTLITKDI